MFADDLSAGDGNELESKFRAAHSSSALAVNCFAPYKNSPSDLKLAGRVGFEKLRFESKCPTGIRGGRAPNLDVLAESDSLVVGVESKCTEYLTRKSWSAKKPPFRSAYFEQIQDERRLGAWYRAMEEIDRRRDRFGYLDVAQLVKHAFGLSRVFKGQNVVLLYLYWEPSTSEGFDEFEAHRSEIADFSTMLGGGFPRFESLTYDGLWKSWSDSQTPPWLSKHIENMRQRYCLSLSRATKKTMW